MIVGNQKVKKLLDDILVSKEYSHAYLFVGPKGVGKTLFAKSLLCESDISCGNCRNCLLFESGNHPDVTINDIDSSLGVDEIREIIDNLNLKPYQAQKKVLVLANADRMTVSAANSLLKTLEEPSKDTIIILTTSSENKLLPTIISRVQTLRFNMLTDTEFTGFLKSSDKSDFSQISMNRIGLAKELSENEDMRVEIEQFLVDFDQTINSAKVWEKLKLAEKMSKNKDKIGLYLDLLESFYEKKIAEEDADKLKISDILDKLSKTKDLLSRNVNQKLIFEALLLGDI